MFKNYFEFKADNNFDLGLQLGTAFKKQAIKKLATSRRQDFWRHLVQASQPLLFASQRVFPQYIAELEGYAKASGINFDEFWAMSLEDEFEWTNHCTSIITNRGRLIGHNEDYDVHTENSICLLKKTIGSLTIFELYYYNTLGGNAISINSHGVIQLVNTLKQTDRQDGIPKNVIGRWLSETRDPRQDFKILKKMKRSSGYNLMYVKTNFGIINIECTAKKQVLTIPKLPCAHANHYLSGLKKYEGYKEKSSFVRLDSAKKLIGNRMDIRGVMDVLNDSSRGKENSIMNENTIGKMVIDLEKKIVLVWLLRESRKGFVKFDLEKIFK